MSVSYTSILWNKNKKRYDLAILLISISFLIIFAILHILLHPDVTFETVLIRGFGWLAILFLHIILAIGPLARLQPRFLPILYNRRHLGVSMFLISLIHGGFSIMHFHGLGDMNPFYSIFLSNLRYNSFINFPFQVLGFFALLILALMASSSHDFWLKNLGAKTWKAMHMLVYLAYGLLVFHIVLGGLQNETSPLIFGVVVVGFVGISVLHILSGFSEWKKDRGKGQAEWFSVAKLSDFEENKAITVCVEGERIAVFLYDNKLSAVNNFCRHQGGPLGEGRILDGCITCPWHGYQYLPHNGQSPAPFDEKVETYELKLEDGEVFVNPKPFDPGTEVEPLPAIS